MIATMVESPGGRLAKLTVISLLLIAMAALVTAPALMPDSYDWLRHTTSESAAQGVQGAWLARLGFLCFGLGVLWLAAQMRGAWPWPVRALHAAFGVLMMATAAFSTKPWLAGATFDPIEDQLHSITATGLGFLFPIALGLRMVARRRDTAGLVFDMLGIVLSLAMPLAMLSEVIWIGVLQRVMFAVAFAWFIVERVRAPATLEAR